MSFFCRGRGIAGSMLPTRNIQSEKQHPLIKKNKTEKLTFFWSGKGGGLLWPKATACCWSCWCWRWCCWRAHCALVICNITSPPAAAPRWLNNKKRRGGNVPTAPMAAYGMDGWRAPRCYDEGGTYKKVTSEGWCQFLCRWHSSFRMICLVLIELTYSW